MLATRKEKLIRMVLFLVFVAAIVTIVALTLYCSNISALNVPKNYKGVFI